MEGGWRVGVQGGAGAGRGGGRSCSGTRGGGGGTRSGGGGGTRGDTDITDGTGNTDILDISGIYH